MHSFFFSRIHNCTLPMSLVCVMGNSSMGESTTNATYLSPSLSHSMCHTTDGLQLFPAAASTLCVSNHKETNFYYYKLFNLMQSSVKYICIRTASPTSTISIYSESPATAYASFWILHDAFRNLKYDNKIGRV